jgi:8-oxo-dGTP pyrophosphatase MutT (NUDIX family)
MNFDALISKLSDRFQHPISTPLSENDMAPFKKRDRDTMLTQNPNPRLGGVYIMLYQKEGAPHFALIKRPSYDGPHSAQIALPGGQKDDTDSDIFYTALRELEEEVGIPKDQVNQIGVLSKVYIPPSKFLVTPVVGYLSGEALFKKDDYEVDEIIEVPLSMLLDDSLVKKGTVQVSGGNMKMKVGYFDMYGHMVWGATAIILNELKHVINEL